MKRLLIIACLLGFAVGLFADDLKILEIGEQAPDFELTGIDGNSYTLDSFREARVLTIVFSANHCPTAQAYEERINKLSADYAPGEMQLVAISSNHPGAVCLEELGYSDLGDTFEEMKIRAADKAYNYPYLYDGDDQKVAMAYGAVATPHVFIFDEERMLRYRGRIDEMEDPYQEPRKLDARNAIDALLAGKPVPVEITKAFGCSMKWKSKMAWRKQLDEEWAAKPVRLNEIDLEDVKGLLENRSETIRLINIWATWCGPCIIEFPELVSLQRMYGQRNFEVVSISVDRPSQKEKVKTFLEGKEAAFTNYLYQPEDRGEMFDLLDPDWQGNIPYTLVVLPGGRVVFRHDGIIDPLEVRRVIIDQIGRYFADDGRSPAKNTTTEPYRKDNLVAWCIVPFDAADRNPEERATMLNELGISQLAYDYRDKHIPSFKREIEVLREHQIRLTAVWFWVEPDGDKVLNSTNKTILKILEETGTKTELWVSFPGPVFDGISEEEKIKKAVMALTEILSWAEKHGCTIALYNHGEWFGEPENQVKIIEAIGSDKIRIVYNFHHGHHQIGDFEELFNLMLPYLSTVNINGMKVKGPKIITLGQGDRELEMLRIIKSSGYAGPIGILGHTEGEDIRMVLDRNLIGLEKLKQALTIGE